MKIIHSFIKSLYDEKPLDLARKTHNQIDKNPRKPIKSGFG